MFEKQIDRDIKGVIKVGQSDEENIYQELEPQIFKEVYSTVMRDSASGMIGVAPEVTIYQFFDILDEKINESVVKNDAE